MLGLYARRPRLAIANGRSQFAFEGLCSRAAIASEQAMMADPNDRYSLRPLRSPQE